MRDAGSSRLEAQETPEPLEPEDPPEEGVVEVPEPGVVEVPEPGVVEVPEPGT
jgi:hypothetical protein